MKILVTGSRGLLGGALKFLELEHTVKFSRRTEADIKFPFYTIHVNPSDDILELSSPIPNWVKGFNLAFLCAGTKGTQECEGNRKVFQADVDGNIRLIRHLLSQDTFVVFVSTDAVETALNTAYARNRFMVELAVGASRSVAIFRPGRFTKDNVHDVAQAMVKVGLAKQGGLHRWP